MATAKDWAQRTAAIARVIKAQKPRSAWGKGVQKYALDLLRKMKDEVLYMGGRKFEGRPLTFAEYKKVMLNGARDWKEYANNGEGLIWNYEIAKRLCSPSEFKKVDGGEKDPNPRENWLDVEARALFQASNLIRDAYNDTSAQSKATNFPESYR